MTAWSKGPLSLLVGEELLISVVFSWDLPAAVEMALCLRALGSRVRIGGPAVILNPGLVPGGVEFVPFEDPAGRDWLHQHNQGASRTSVGCPRSCEFCAVKRLHPERKEIRDFRPAPILCDDNFLACSRKHRERAYERLKGVPGVDFNQGLDARLFRKSDLEGFQGLDLSCLRFAWDDASEEAPVRRAIGMALAGGIPKSKIRVYVLCCFKESPEEALYRCEELMKLGVLPVPMRYQPLDARERNEYLGELWTHDEARRFMRYWSRIRFFRNIPYSEFSLDRSQDGHRGEPTLF